MRKILLITLITSVLLSNKILANQTLLLRDPDISDNKIAFVYGGDIWVAKKDGSEIHVDFDEDLPSNQFWMF